MLIDERQKAKWRLRAAQIKNPTPVELPSGKWRCQVTVDGKRISAIDADPTVAHAKALALKANLLSASAPVVALSVGQAFDRYIESKDTVLSPATVAGYKRIKKNALQGIMGIKLGALTQEKVQREINAMAKQKSPKSIRNAHGLLSAVLAEYRPDMLLRTTLPQKQRYEAAIPSGDDIDVIMQASIGTKMELPVLLAVWLGLRVSEIRGITKDCIKGDVIHIKQAIVDAEDGPKLKGTKSYSGDRKIRIPAHIKELIEAQPGEHATTLTGQAIYKRFTRLCEKANLPHYRFHDLRHANASVMLALGVPDKYAMERMGHATSNMLKMVYQHTMRDKQDEVADAVDSYFEGKLHTELHTAKGDT